MLRATEQSSPLSLVEVLLRLCSDWVPWALSLLWHKRAGVSNTSDLILDFEWTSLEARERERERERYIISDPPLSYHISSILSIGQAGTELEGGWCSPSCPPSVSYLPSALGSLLLENNPLSIEINWVFEAAGRIVNVFCLTQLTSTKTYGWRLATVSPVLTGAGQPPSATQHQLESMI